MQKLRNFFRNNKGATAIEYGLIAALIAVAAIAAMNTLSGSIQGTFTRVGGELDKAGTTTPPANPPANPPS